MKLKRHLLTAALTLFCLSAANAQLLRTTAVSYTHLMNLYLEADESVLGVIFIAHRRLDGLDAGSRRCENHRMATLLGILGIEAVSYTHLT